MTTPKNNLIPCEEPTESEKIVPIPIIEDGDTQWVFRHYHPDGYILWSYRKTTKIEGFDNTAILKKMYYNNDTTRLANRRSAMISKEPSVKLVAPYKDGKPHGISYNYYEDGSLARMTLNENGKWIWIKTYNRDGSLRSIQNSGELPTFYP